MQNSTFNINTPNKTINNLTLNQTLSELSEYLADYNTKTSQIQIIWNYTGEIINDCKYFYSSKSNKSYTIFELLELIPYLDRISPIQIQLK